MGEYLRPPDPSSAFFLISSRASKCRAYDLKDLIAHLRDVTSLLRLRRTLTPLRTLHLPFYTCLQPNFIVSCNIRPADTSCNMRVNHASLLLPLFYSALVWAQIADPSLPPQVVSKHAQDVLGSESATPCDTAVCLTSLGCVW